MTDRQPPSPAPAQGQPASPEAAPERHLTFGQQLFIWSMVIIVGVVFGIGASFSLVFVPTVKVAGVAEGEVIYRMQLADRLERVLNPHGHPLRPLFRHPPTLENQLEAYAIDLRLSRLAESRGLLPKGEALDRLESEFLATPLGNNRTYRDALREHVGGPQEISRQDLRRFLAERAARQALVARAAIAPAVPLAIAEEVVIMRGDRAGIYDVTISGAHLVPTVAPDDPEIPAVYERLRTTRFATPPAVAVAVAWADRDELGAQLAISDAEAEAWYAAHQQEFAPKPDPAKPDEQPAPKPFAEVKDEVFAKLRAERGSREAQRRIEDFNRRGEELENERDGARFRAAVAEAGLKLAELTIVDRTPGTIDLGELGTCKDLMRLFGREHEPGFLSEPIATSKGHWAMLRLERRIEAGFRSLDEVREEVRRYLAGRRAWERLIAEATRLRDELTTQGEDAVSKWARSEAGKVWQADVQARSVPLMMRFPGVPSDPDGTASEPVLVAAVAQPSRPVFLAAAEPLWKDDVPRLRLLQVYSIDTAPRDRLPRVAFARQVRSWSERYGEVLLDRELQAKLGMR
ncbi:MAG: peptidylprolyl isomerase [Planctomycetota bacterium]|nr:peptidylprolyl isomerase [Planctomycetota bacterium]